MLIATLAGIGVGLLVSVLLVLVGGRLVLGGSEPVLMILILLGSAATIAGVGGLTTGTVARVRTGASKGLLTGAAVVVGMMVEATALAVAYSTAAQHDPAVTDFAAFEALAIVLLGLVGASVGGPLAAALVIAFRRPPAGP